jgi:hypothetical protein
MGVCKALMGKSRFLGFNFGVWALQGGIVWYGIRIVRRSKSGSAHTHAFAGGVKG